MVIAAGAAGVQLLPRTSGSRDPISRGRRFECRSPEWHRGLEATDRARERDGVICYGAIGVGATKMKIHKAAIRKLFTANDLVLDAEEVFALGQESPDSAVVRMRGTVLKTVPQDVRTKRAPYGVSRRSYCPASAAFGFERFVDFLGRGLPTSAGQSRFEIIVASQPGDLPGDIAG